MQSSVSGERELQRITGSLEIIDVHAGFCLVDGLLCDADEDWVACRVYVDRQVYGSPVQVQCIPVSMHRQPRALVLC